VTPSRTGQDGSLLALAANATDAKGRIVAAAGRRPRLRNLTAAEVAHFRAHVGVVDLIGTTGATAVLAAAQECAARDPGPAPDPPGGRAVPICRRSPPAALMPTRPAAWSCMPTLPGGCW